MREGRSARVPLPNPTPCPNPNNFSDEDPRSWNRSYKNLDLGIGVAHRKLTLPSNYLLQIATPQAVDSPCLNFSVCGLYTTP